MTCLFIFTASDGIELKTIKKVKVLRNDKRQGQFTFLSSTFDENDVHEVHGQHYEYFILLVFVTKLLKFYFANCYRQDLYAHVIDSNLEHHLVCAKCKFTDEYQDSILCIDASKSVAEIKLFSSINILYACYSSIALKMCHILWQVL